MLYLLVNLKISVYIECIYILEYYLEIWSRSGESFWRYERICKKFLTYVRCNRLPKLFSRNIVFRVVEANETAPPVDLKISHELHELLQRKIETRFRRYFYVSHFFEIHINIQYSPKTTNWILPIATIINRL